MSWGNCLNGRLKRGLADATKKLIPPESRRDGATYLRFGEGGTDLEIAIGSLHHTSANQSRIRANQELKSWDFRD